MPYTATVADVEHRQSQHPLKRRTKHGKIATPAAACEHSGESNSMGRSIRQKIAQFVPTDLTFDEGLLRDNDKQVLVKLVEAARYIDEIFLRQVSPRNPELLRTLETSETTESTDLLHYFRIMFGPWDRIDGHRPFIGEEQKPLGAGFYPPDLTKDEFESWLAEHPEDKEAFTSYYTSIRRENGRLVAVPYSSAYEEFLTPSARLLEEAADLSDNPSLAKFLRSRAEAFRSNDYFESEIDWMDVNDSLIDLTIGPYEVYEDRLLSYKAAFEAVVALKDPQESQRLETLTGYLGEIEDNLPGAGEYQAMERGASSPISVVSVVFSAGEIKPGVQAAAFVLPNDEKVRQTKGSKKVMLKNIAEAKFRNCTLPTAERIMAEEQLPMMDFEALFDVVLMHELAHSMGPGFVPLPDGSKATVGLVLKELYPSIEETKADVAGVCAFSYLVDKGVLSGLEQACVSLAVATLRSLRFGIDTAHGRAALVELNFLSERGGLLYDEGTNRFRVDSDIMLEAMRELTRRVLLLQAQGDYQGVKEFLGTYGQLTPPLEKAMLRVADIPVDIEPVFPIEQIMRDW